MAWTRTPVCKGLTCLIYLQLILTHDFEFPLRRKTFSWEILAHSSHFLLSSNSTSTSLGNWDFCPSLWLDLSWKVPRNVFRPPMAPQVLNKVIPSWWLLGYLGCWMGCLADISVFLLHSKAIHHSPILELNHRTIPPHYWMALADALHGHH